MGSGEVDAVTGEERKASAIIVLQAVGGIYIIVGFLHSLYFDFFMSRSDCLTAEGILSIYCNTGVGISHAVVVLGWPFLYF